ncbi:MAG: hypothetical protein COA88_07930 [Kordia sp.]|nr:MAG: hypothetical protein COA88_07930 [Kordia sp.]
MIGHVQLNREELPALRELLDIEDENGNGFFLQPCSKYCDGCSIYSQRPKQCASFNCGLLTSYEQNELDFDSAIEIINRVKQKKIAIEKNLVALNIKLKSESFYFKMVELKKVLQKIKSESSLTKKHIELTVDLEELDSLLTNSFGISSY